MDSVENANPIEPKKLKVAIDFGGVISIIERNDKWSYFSKKSETSDHNTAKINMPYVKEELIKLRQKHSLYLNSFCGETRAVETALVIKSELPDIFEEIIFVKDRKFKGLICQKFGCHVLIDDRLDVLRQAKQIFPDLQCILFYTNQKIDKCEFPIATDWRLIGDILDKLIDYNPDIKPLDVKIDSLSHNV